MPIPLSAPTETFEHMKRSGDYYVTVVEDTNLGQIVATATLVIEHKFTHSCAKVNSLAAAVKWGIKIPSPDSARVIFMVWWSTFCWVSDGGTLKISPILGRSAKYKKEALAFLGGKKSNLVSVPFSFWTQEVVLPEQMAEDLAGVPAGRVTTGRERDTNLPAGKGCGGTTAPLGCWKGRHKHVDQRKSKHKMQSSGETHTTVFD